MSKFDKQKYDNEYAKNNYDRCIFNLTKGTKEPLMAYIKTMGHKSLNEYVLSLIRADLQTAVISMDKEAKRTGSAALEAMTRKNTENK